MPAASSERLELVSSLTNPDVLGPEDPRKQTALKGWHAFQVALATTLPTKLQQAKMVNRATLRHLQRVGGRR